MTVVPLILLVFSLLVPTLSFATLGVIPLISVMNYGLWLFLLPGAFLLRMMGVHGVGENIVRARRGLTWFAVFVSTVITTAIGSLLSLLFLSRYNFSYAFDQRTSGLAVMIVLFFVALFIAAVVIDAFTYRWLQRKANVRNDRLNRLALFSNLFIYGSAAIFVLWSGMV